MIIETEWTFGPPPIEHRVDGRVLQVTVASEWMSIQWHQGFEEWRRPLTPVRVFDHEVESWASVKPVTESVVITIDKIKSAVKAVTGIGRMQMASKNRMDHVVVARWIVVMVAYKSLLLSATDIAYSMGKRDRAFVSYACSEFIERLKVDPQAKRYLLQVLDILGMKDLKKEFQ